MKFSRLIKSVKNQRINFQFVIDDVPACWLKKILHIFPCHWPSQLISSSLTILFSTRSPQLCFFYVLLFPHSLTKLVCMYDVFISYLIVNNNYTYFSSNSNSNSSHTLTISREIRELECARDLFV